VKPRKTLFCREKREQYAAQVNCVSPNKAKRVKLNYLGRSLFLWCQAQPLIFQYSYPKSSAISRARNGEIPRFRRFPDSQIPGTVYSFALAQQEYCAEQ
jgi:hypothetical protein